MRRHIARKFIHLMRLRRWTRCAVAIQMKLRCYVARGVLVRLRKEAWDRLRHRSAIVIQCRWRQRMAYIIYLTLRHARRDRAARIIQRLHRGREGRRLFKVLNALRTQLRERRHKAAVVIQCMTRQSIARRLVAWRKIHMKALKLIHLAVSKWIKKRLLLKRRLNSCLLIQRIFRGMIGRKKSKELRIIQRDALRKDEFERRKELRDMSSNDRACPDSLHVTEVRVPIPKRILRSMIENGPSSVVEWCIQQNILSLNVSPMGLHENDKTVSLCFGSLTNQVLMNTGFTINDSTPLYAPDDMLEYRTVSIQRSKQSISKNIFDRYYQHLFLPNTSDCKYMEEVMHSVPRIDDSSNEQVVLDAAFLPYLVKDICGFNNRWGEFFQFGQNNQGESNSHLKSNVHIKCDHKIFFGNKILSCWKCRYRERGIRKTNRVLIERRNLTRNAASSNKIDSDIYLTILHSLGNESQINIDDNRTRYHDDIISQHQFILVFEEGTVYSTVDMKSSDSNEMLSSSTDLTALDFRFNKSLIKVTLWDRQVTQIPTAVPEELNIQEDEGEEWMLPSYQAAVASYGKHTRPVTARVVHVLVLEEEVKDLIPYDAKAAIIQVTYIITYHHCVISISNICWLVYCSFFF